jgi:hypothetical protein
MIFREAQLRMEKGLANSICFQISYWIIYVVYECNVPHLCWLYCQVRALEAALAAKKAEESKAAEKAKAKEDKQLLHSQHARQAAVPAVASQGNREM